MKASNCCLIYTGRPRALHGVVCVLELVIERSQLASGCGFSRDRSSHSSLWRDGCRRERPDPRPRESRVPAAGGEAEICGTDDFGVRRPWAPSPSDVRLGPRGAAVCRPLQTSNSIRKHRPLFRAACASGTEVPICVRMGAALRLSFRCASSFRCFLLRRCPVGEAIPVLPADVQSAACVLSQGKRTFPPVFCATDRKISTGF